MRALRVATPISVAVLTGCSLPVDEFRAPSDSGGAEAAPNDTGAAALADGHVAASDGGDAGTDGAGCLCVRQQGSKCREWSPPGCGD